jgi:hypothetical protein
MPVNRIVVDNDTFDMDPAYCRGALAASIGGISQPYSSGSAQAVSWQHGADHERACEHVRFGLYLPRAAAAAMVFAQDPDVPRSNAGMVERGWYEQATTQALSSPRQSSEDFMRMHRLVVEADGQSWRLCQHADPRPLAEHFPNPKDALLWVDQARPSLQRILRERREEASLVLSPEDDIAACLPAPR